MRFLIAWLALALALVGTSAHAALPARPAGPILDQANVIPDDREAALAKKLEDYNRATGRAVLVVTVASLEGQDIESFGSALGHAWGVGGKDTDQGLILLVAPSERKVRIEVGYGLEEYMPDALAGRIVREVITPRFKAGDLGGGIGAGIDAIVTQLDRSPADAKAVAEAAKAGAHGKDDSASVPSILFWILLIGFFAFIFSRGGGRRSHRRSGIDPGIVLWGASEAARHWGGSGGGFSGGGSDGGGFGGFGGGDFGGGGASGDW